MRRRLRDSGQHRGLSEIKISGVDAEIPLGGGFNPVVSAAVIDDVEVPGEYLRFAVGPSETDGYKCFGKFAVQRLRVSLIRRYKRLLY